MSNCQTRINLCSKYFYQVVWKVWNETRSPKPKQNLCCVFNQFLKCTLKAVEKSLIFIIMFEFSGQIYKSLKSKRRRGRLLKRWNKSFFKRSTQKRLELIEEKQLDEAKKREIIKDTLYQNNSQNFTSFVVCRNPLEKLYSVYQYLGDTWNCKLWHNLVTIFTPNEH